MLTGSSFPPSSCCGLGICLQLAQAIQCGYPNMKPLPCQKDGCNALVHHLCQSAWEQQEGYVDTIARLCCVHHPDYKYHGAPRKEDVIVAKAQDVISKAKAFNVESQITTEDIDGLLSKDDDLVDEESSNGCDDGDGSDDPSNDPVWVETVLV